MSPQYKTAKLCLQMLQASEITTNQKLRLEIQLIQLLRLLLTEDVGCTVAGPCSEEAFDALLEEVAVIRKKRGHPDAINCVMERLGSMLAALSERADPALNSDGAF